MSAPPSTKPNNSSVAAPRKGVEKPKPLKPSTNIAALSVGNGPKRSSLILHPGDQAEEVLALYETVSRHLDAKKYDKPVIGMMVKLNAALKLHGPFLEQHYKDHLDRYQVALRTACRDGKLDLVARLQLLEIIEMRAMKWKPNENVSNYYKQKMSQVQHSGVNGLTRGSNIKDYEAHSTSLNVNAPDFMPQSTANYLASATASLTTLLSVGGGVSDDQVVPSTSSNLGRPNRVSGKTLFKDDVLIRNSDSGKVSASARDRLVQITGSEEAKINSAKDLIEETIRRNQSPTPPAVEVNEPLPLSGAGDVCRITGDYRYSVNVGDFDVINIQGSNAELVKIAKVILDEHFGKHAPSSLLSRPKDVALRKPMILPNSIFFSETARESEAIGARETNNNNLEEGTKVDPKKILKYDRKSLITWAKSPLCAIPPTNWSPEWDEIKAENPTLVRQAPSPCLTGDGDGNNSKVGDDVEQTSSPPPPLPELHETPSFPGFVKPMRPYVNNNNFFKVGPVNFIPPRQGFDPARPDLPLRTWDENIGQWIETTRS